MIHTKQEQIKWKKREIKKKKTENVVNVIDTALFDSSSSSKLTQYDWNILETFYVFKPGLISVTRLSIVDFPLGFL